MDEEFQVGDVVQLKSGGTRMTVEQIDGDRIACVWFEGKDATRDTFTDGVLMKYRPMTPVVRMSRR